MEYKLGKTIGKLITGTRVVYANGDSINLRTAILRSLSRLVPFEAFSLLGTPPRGWYDDWTDTYVVNEKILEEQKEHFHNFKDLGIERND
ncbi:MAG: RDD family protein [Flavobacteriaceae bacterium]|nr:RDD family protein [Flavobacteriaceae bacterium]